jgi:hypothetical protein
MDKGTCVASIVQRMVQARSAERGIDRFEERLINLAFGREPSVSIR